MVVGHLVGAEGGFADEHPAAPPRPASYNKKIALVLQGGDALGSCQAGVYEALSTSDYPPGWVAGIPMGAVNAAIIAGNAPERRVARLRQFWEGITAPPASGRLGSTTRSVPAAATTGRPPLPPRCC
jgi:predicted acylesterase/phospholipase RssA